MHDVVYTYKRWVADWIELRYSLRSLENLKHWNVFIIWDKPTWAKNIIHIPMSDASNKYINVRRKCAKMSLDKRISEDFILMNDDFYILKPIDKLWYYIRWTMEDSLDEIEKTVWRTTFYEAINTVYKMYPEWDCFAVHAPIIFNKKKLYDIMKKYWHKHFCKRSLYCNYYNIEWEPLKWWITDCKIWWDKELTVNDEREFMSSNDDIEKREDIIKFLNKKFPHKSKYEV